MSNDHAISPFSAKQAELNAASSFAALCVAFCSENNESSMQPDFPLRGRVQLRSQINFAFPTREFSVGMLPENTRKEGDLPVIWLAFFTLAGGGGALPNWVSEKIILDRQGDGKALHAFLDLLNRRFWELLFLAQGAGHNPHYALLNRRHTQSLRELSYAVAGLGQVATMPRMVSGARVLHNIEQRCLAAMCGTGGTISLAELLTQTCDRRIRLREYVPMRLSVVDRMHLSLGRKGRSGGISRGQVIGAKAWVACALVVIVLLADVDDINQYLPGDDGAQLVMMERILGIFYMENMPPMTLQLQCLAHLRYSELGARTLRLGWGARLTSGLPASQIIRLSRLAMETGLP